MKIKFLLQIVLICAFFAPVYAQEGLNWWSDAKSSDFIVEGIITYDQEKFYELSAINIEDEDKKYYWLVGSMKIDKVLYINKTSEHLEEYQLFLKDLKKTCPVLIPAYESIIFSNAAKPRRVLRPVLGIDITKEATILNLTQITIFPILGVTVESLVPIENIGQVRAAVAKRDNNLLAK